MTKFNRKHFIRKFSIWAERKRRRLAKMEHTSLMRRMTQKLWKLNKMYELSKTQDNDHEVPIKSFNSQKRSFRLNDDNFLYKGWKVQRRSIPGNRKRSGQIHHK